MNCVQFSASLLAMMWNHDGASFERDDPVPYPPPHVAGRIPFGIQLHFQLTVPGDARAGTWLGWQHWTAYLRGSNV